MSENWFVRDGVYHAHEQGDEDTAVTVAITEADGIHITCTEEQSVDSYNQTFKCSIWLTWPQATALMEYLHKHSPGP
jgi:hypothetical protein